MFLVTRSQILLLAVTGLYIGALGGPDDSLDGTCAEDDYVCKSHGNVLYIPELEKKDLRRRQKQQQQRGPRPPAPPPLESAQNVPPNTPMTVTFHNKGNLGLVVYWKNPDSNGENVLMGSLDGGSTMPMNSFTGHTFLLRPAGSILNREEVTVRAGQKDYWFDPDSYEMRSNLGAATQLQSTESLELQEKQQNDNLLLTFGTSVAVKFRNLSGKRVQLWYDDGSTGVRSSVIKPGGDATTNSYPGHVFCFTEMWLQELPGGGDCGITSGMPPGVLGKATVNENDYTYLFDDGSASNAEKQRWQEELAFDKEYLKQNGRHWVSFYPRPPPVLHMWDADYIGQVHTITTRHTKFDCTSLEGKSSTSTSLSAISSEDLISCREGGIELEQFPQNLDVLNIYDEVSGKWGASLINDTHYPTLDINMQVLSIYPGPRVFLIEDLISPSEADHIVSVGAPKVSRSMTGQANSAYESDTRTSRTGWIPRDASPIMDAIFRRVADVLRIDEKLLQADRNAELLQVVHYDPHQKYDAHHGKAC